MTDEERQAALKALVEERIARARREFMASPEFARLKAEFDQIWKEGNVPPDSPLARLLVGDDNGNG